MLKSTHRPTNAQGGELQPLPEGWTEHKAPTDGLKLSRGICFRGEQTHEVLTRITGHSYYYHAATKQSTYTRPAATASSIAPVQPPAAPIPTADPSLSFLQYQSVHEGGPDSNAPRDGHNFGRGGFSQRGGRGGHDQQRPRGPQPTDKPKSRRAIPGCEPWILVHTKLGRRFVYNPDKEQSYWRIPEKLKAGILELDQLRIKEKADALTNANKSDVLQAISGAAERPGAPLRNEPSPAPVEGLDGNESSEYEEVEVTDDEGEDDEENAAKRQRVEDEAPEEPVEFNEDDIAFQLAAMGQEHGLEPGEYDDGNMEDWQEGAEGLELTEEDAIALFIDLLNDFNINPYSPWDKLIDEGRLVDDTRYTALPNMKARKEAWETWSRDKIKELKEKRLKEAKKDPRIPYMAFLQANATPKLYWPEFKRKFKKEAEMRDPNLTDKEREKSYREYINRLKLPTTTLKTDFLDLLKAQPVSKLNSQTLPDHLPSDVLADVKYISVDEKTRSQLLEAFISTLPPPPTEAAAEESEEQLKRRVEKERREKALRDREDRVEEQKRKQRRQLEFGKGRLREEEEEIRRAMDVGKKGLMGHLQDSEQGS